MAVYHVKHDCGFEQKLFLPNETKSTRQLNCMRCNRLTTARRIDDKSIKVGQADDLYGILRRNDAAAQQ